MKEDFFCQDVRVLFDKNQDEGMVLESTEDYQILKSHRFKE